MPQLTYSFWKEEERVEICLSWAEQTTDNLNFKIMFVSIWRKRCSMKVYWVSVSGSTIYNQTWSSGSRSSLQLRSDLTHTRTPWLISSVPSQPFSPVQSKQDCTVITPMSDTEPNQAWNLDLIAWLCADCNWPHWELMVDWTIVACMLNAIVTIFHSSLVPFVESKERLVKAKKKSGDYSIWVWAWFIFTILPSGAC